MQGDIFELEGILHPVTAKHVKFQEINDSPATIDEHVSATLIYNEDDMCHHLHQPLASLHEHHLDLHGHDTTLAHARYLSQIASVFDDYYIDETPDFTDDSAACSDDEFDEIPPPTKRFPSPNTAISISEENSKSQEEERVIIPATEHVAEIQGQCMSWWPLPIEQEQYDFDHGEAFANKCPESEGGDTSSRRRKGTVPDDHHVLTIQGQLMTWWPLKIEDLEYEWSERFYE